MFMGCNDATDQNLKHYNSLVKELGGQPGKTFFSMHQLILWHNYRMILGQHNSSISIIILSEPLALDLISKKVLYS